MTREETAQGTAKAVKHKHEWFADGKRFCVYFPDDNAGWWVQVEEGESDLAEEVVVTALSNEIARLRGLVPPGGEEEKG